MPAVVASKETQSAQTLGGVCGKDSKATDSAVSQAWLVLIKLREQRLEVVILQCQLGRPPPS